MTGNELWAKRSNTKSKKEVCRNLFSSNFFIFVDKSVISCEALRRTYLPTLSHLRQANCPHAENGERCSLALQAAADSHVNEDPPQKYDNNAYPKI